MEEINKKKNRFIIKKIKHTEIYDEDGNDFFRYVFHEFVIYQLMNILVKKHITPYVIMGNSLVPCNDNTDTNSQEANNSQEAIPSQMLINETSGHNVKETLNLNEFINKYKDEMNKFILLHILFQLVYTLLCFNRIGLQHCDLHIQNILVFIRNNNVFEYDKWYNKVKTQKMKTYKFKTDTMEFSLVDIGIDIRIYDFDHAIKKTMDLKNPELQSLNRESYAFPEDKETKKFSSNQDLFYVIYNLYNSFLEIIRNFPKTKETIIDCLFTLQNYLNTDTLNKLILSETKTISKNNSNSTSNNSTSKRTSNISRKTFLNKSSYLQTNSNKLSKSGSSGSFGSSGSSGIASNNSITNMNNIKKRHTLKNNRSYESSILFKERISLLTTGNLTDNIKKQMTIFNEFIKKFAKPEYSDFFQSLDIYLQKLMVALKKEYTKRGLYENINSSHVIDSFDITKLV